MIRYATLRYDIYIYIKKYIIVCIWIWYTKIYWEPTHLGSRMSRILYLGAGTLNDKCSSIVGKLIMSICMFTHISISAICTSLSLSPFPLPSGTGFYQNTICVVKSRFPSPTICPPRPRYETQCPRLMTYLCGCSRSSRANLKSL